MLCIVTVVSSVKYFSGMLFIKFTFSITNAFNLSWAFLESFKLVVHPAFFKSAFKLFVL